MDGNEQIIPAALVIPHPNYESWYVNNDVMLIKLSEAATINQYVRPVALPSSCAAAGTMCTVSGWGVTMSSGGCRTFSLRCVCHFPNILCSQDEMFETTILCTKYI